MKAWFPGDPYFKNMEIVDEAAEALFFRTGEWADKWTGWLNHPNTYHLTDEYKNLKETAAYIRKKFDVVLSCGIGGSYLGARAVIEATYGEYNESPRRKGPKMYFVGQNTSADVINDIIERCKGKKVCIINISKSGKTLETALSFRTLFKSCKPDVVAITGKTGTLHKMTEENLWESFAVPEDIGGRYSVFTAVGLLPIAIAGINTDELLMGAAKATEPEGIQLAKEYAAYRNYCSYCPVEFFAVNSPWLTQLLEWHKQLYAESHGKNCKGTFPTGGTYPMDLHSVGQFIQEGSPIMFETQLYRKSWMPLNVPVVKELNDDLDSYSVLSFDEINKAQMDGTKKAHEKSGISVARFELENTLEDLAYFMQVDMMACPIEAYMIGVNPFDQPGVEQHKKATAELLNGIIQFRKN